MPGSPFTDADLRQLEQQGIGAEEAERQLSLFEKPPGHAELVRPCTPGDGIDVLADSDLPDLLKLHDEASRANRCLKFVPASGAATRMFTDLLFFHQGDGHVTSWNDVQDQATRGVAAARGLVRFRDELRRFAFYDDLKLAIARNGGDLEHLAASGDPGALLDGLLAPGGLAYAELPKGLLKFHRYPDESRTPLEEHLVEAADYASGGNGRCRLHLTVSTGHLELFRARMEKVRDRYEQRHGVRYEVAYSVQKPSTDTLAVDLHNQPFRTGAGRLLFRPGGHGALIENLHELQGDIVFVKNIDNVQPDHAKGPTLRWKKVLAGYLIHLQQRIFDYQRRLRESSEDRHLLDEARSFVRRRLHVESAGGSVPNDPQEMRRYLLARLLRPLRVCGMVRNTGEPGGGPFWARGQDGSVGLQIVEEAQIDPDSEEQQQILRSSTHFNPVDLVCGVRDADDVPFDLHDYVDQQAVLISKKSSDGRELKALERPGLWNGAMARWNTVFVDVPLQTFSPVKTVFDLFREEHQPQS